MTTTEVAASSFVAPRNVASGTVIDARKIVVTRSLDHCAICRDRITPEQQHAVKRYCSRAHKKVAEQIRGGRNTRGRKLIEDAPLGTCPVCGEKFDLGKIGPQFCSPEHRGLYRKRLEAMQQGFAGKVEKAEDLLWLAQQLRLDYEHPRLPEIAWRLARAGRLVAYINPEGHVVLVGKERRP